MPFLFLFQTSDFFFLNIFKIVRFNSQNLAWKQVSLRSVYFKFIFVRWKKEYIEFICSSLPKYAGSKDSSPMAAVKTARNNITEK